MSIKQSAACGPEHKTDDWELRTIDMEQRAQVGIDCPKCRQRQFMEVEIDPQFANTPLALEIQKHLEEWLLSRCPDHLGEFLKSAKN